MSASLMGPEDQGQRVGKEAKVTAKEGEGERWGGGGGGRERQTRFAANMRDATEITF